MKIHFLNLMPDAGLWKLTDCEPDFTPVAIPPGYSLHELTPPAEKMIVFGAGDASFAHQFGGATAADETNTVLAAIIGPDGGSAAIHQ